MAKFTRKKRWEKRWKKNTNQQFLTSQKLGKLYGFKVGKSRQSKNLVEALKQSSIWYHKKGLIVKVFSTETFQLIVDQLNYYVPTITNASCFIKVFYGERAQLYG
jgi:hypothetical protein